MKITTDIEGVTFRDTLSFAKQILQNSTSIDYIENGRHAGKSFVSCNHCNRAAIYPESLMHAEDCVTHMANSMIKQILERTTEKVLIPNADMSILEQMVNDPEVSLHTRVEITAYLGKIMAGVGLDDMISENP